MNRSTRIIILLVIDVIFFFVELIVGYAVGSLALVADSFHMLNDVLSLVVALYAINLSNQTSADPRYSYGWHRAEILAALINGVFLLALCFSIFLEAIERFFSTPEISNPRLVVIVGTLGLASNIVGLFLFHEHSHNHDHGKVSPSNSKPASIHSGHGQEHTHRSDSLAIPPSSPRQRTNSYTSLSGHPAATRASIMAAAESLARSPSPATARRHSRSQSRGGYTINIEEAPEETVESSTSEETRYADETTRLLPETASAESVPHSLHDDGLKAHGHEHGHGHSHGSMNMRALLLHVMGDALGNVGVIATGLVIWLSSWSFKYYFDPVISLVITVIIFSSALPLVRSTSFILLQGVPSTISIEEVRDAILAVDGVLSLHELHVWQLSETKIVASVHVMASRDHDFMPVAAQIRKALHHHGIHSSTIQPEYYPAKNALVNGIMTSANGSCLILCPPDQECDPTENSCCPPPPAEV